MGKDRKEGVLLSEVDLKISIKGTDAEGHPFIETSPAFPVGRGVVVIDTIHDLTIGVSLEVTEIDSKRSTVGRVKSLGPKAGVRKRVLIELENATYLWWGEFPAATDRRKKIVTEVPSPPSAEEAHATPGKGGGGDQFPVAGLLQAVEPTKSSEAAPGIPVSHGGEKVPGPVMEISEERAATAVPRAEEPLKVPTPPEASPKTSTPRITVSDRFTDILSEVVKFTLEANLHPVVEEAVGEFRQRVEQTKDLARLSLEEQSHTILREIANRLKTEAAAACLQAEGALEKRIQELIDKAGQDIGSRKELFGSELEKAVLHNKEELERQAQSTVAEASTSLRLRAEEESAQLAQQFAEKCRSLGEPLLTARLEEAGNTLSNRAQQVESDLATRLSQQADKEAGHFSGAIEKHIQEGLGNYAAGLQERLEEANNALSNRTREVETALVIRLSQQAEEIAKLFSAEIDRRLQQALGDYSVGLVKRLEEVQDSLLTQPTRWEEILTGHLERHAEAIASRQSADMERKLEHTGTTMRQAFLKQTTDQLNQVREQSVQQTRRMVEDAAHENLSRVRKEMARLIREIAEAMVNQVDSISHL